MRITSSDRMVRVKYIGFLRTSLKVSFGGETGNDMSMGAQAVG